MDSTITKENSRQKRFVELLKRIFEMDKSDLDFGIYRILNIRKNEIEKYFSESLPQIIAEILTPFAEQGVEGVRKEMAELEKSAKSMMGVDISEIPQDSPMAIKYRELKLKLASGTDLSALESDVYSALIGQTRTSIILRQAKISRTMLSMRLTRFLFISEL